MKNIFLLLLIISIKTSNSQPPTIRWEHTYGGGQVDRAFHNCKDSNENMWICGDASGDALIFNIDSSGNQRFLNRYGGTVEEDARQLLINFSGNIVFVGKASSFDGDVQGLHGDTTSIIGEEDLWLVCLDSIGNILWQKCLGGTFDDRGYSILQTSDSGYVVFGEVESNDGDVSNYIGIIDLWVAKISKFGNLQWRKSYGGTNVDLAGKIISTNDGGFIICSTTESYDHDITNNYGSYDIWVAKLSASGQIQWQKNYGGSGFDEAREILISNTNGYYIVGSTSSNDHDITNSKGLSDIFILKIDSVGNLLWSQNLGGSEYDVGNSACLTNNGIEVVGFTYSDDIDFSGNHGNKDVAVIEIEENGSVVWTKCLGGSDDEEGFSVISTSDGGSVISGYTLSSDGDIGTPNAGNSQAWVLRLSPNPLSIQVPKNSINILSFKVEPGAFHLNLNSIVSENILIKFYDIYGRIIFNQKERINNGNNDITFNGFLSPGIYILNISGKEYSLSLKIFYR